jgi:hypothetical protein
MKVQALPGPPPNYALFQRFLAAATAISLRRSGVNAAARFKPLWAVAGFFFFWGISPIDIWNTSKARVLTSMRSLSVTLSNAATLLDFKLDHYQHSRNSHPRSSHKK